MRRRRPVILLTPILLLALASSPAPAAAESLSGAAEADANLGRGFDPTKAYDSGDVDSVNLFNGNLTLAIPLGRAYPGDAGFSFGLGLVYNSNLWEFETWTANEVAWGPSGPPADACGIYNQAWPSWLFNAGIGWEVSLGRLYAPGPAQRGDVPGPGDEHLAGVPVNAGQPWVYLGPDGSRHELFTSLHDELGASGTPPAPPLYSRDGSYLRLRDSPGSCGELVVESPDGGRSCFELDPHEPEGHGYRPVRLEDAHGNGVSIGYSADGLTWTVTDDHDRVWSLEFTAPPAGTFGRSLLQTVELPGVDQPYTFHYSYADVARSCQDNYPWDSADYQGLFGTRDLPVALLDSIELPDGSSFAFAYDTSLDCLGGNGLVQSMTLPTGGEVAWSYGAWEFPSTQECPDPRDFPMDFPTCSYDREPVNLSVGVVERRVYDLGESPGTAAEEAVRTWSYFPQLTLGSSTGGQFPRLCEAFTDRRTVVIDPLGHRTVHYHSVYARGDDPEGLGWRRSEYGLPFTRAEQVATPDGPVFLSAETFDCGDPGNRDPEDFAGCTLLRSDYLRYEHDPVPYYCELEGTSPDFCNDHNARVVARRSEAFDPDQGEPGGVIAFTGERLSDFDGLGHHRKELTSGDLCPRNSGICSGDIRETFVGFNPDRGTLVVAADGSLGGDFAPPAPTDRWLLATFDLQWTREGGRREVTEYDFDPDTGFLLRQRQHFSTSTIGSPEQNRHSRDVVVRRVEDSRGNVVRELTFGGDLHPLVGASSALSSLSLPEGDAEYRVDRSWKHGILESVEAVDPQDSASRLLQLYNSSIDRESGRVLASQDASGVEVQYEYDGFGRLTRVVPDGEAATSVGYVLRAGSQGAKVLVGRPSLSASGPGSTRREVTFDGFGRVAVDRTRHPQGWIRQQNTYFATGAAKTRTTPYFETCTDPVGCPKGTTIYTAYDPFGRPLAVLRPGHDPAAGRDYRTTYRYDGSRGRIVKTFGIALDDATPQSTNSVSQFEDYDRQGRMWRVSRQEGPTTTFRYDVGDRLVEVKVAEPSGTFQKRTSGYDGRGFLATESHPEVTGTILHGDHDSRGNPGRLQKGWSGTNGSYRVDLGFSYDFAGRLVQVTEHPDGPEPVRVEERFYAPTNQDGGKTAGKLVATKRLNLLHRSEGAKRRHVTVTENLFYGDAAGRLTRQTARTFDPSGDYPSLRFVTEFEYDALGNLSSVLYPDCDGTGLCPPSEPSFALANSYTNGLLTRVEEIAPQQPWVFASDLTYSASGALRTVTHGNGVVDHWLPDVSGLPRPGRIEARKSSALLWSTGEYRFDGAQLVSEVGSDRYFYDALGRLTSAEVHAPGPIVAQRGYGYDGFGNLLTIDRDGVVLTLPVEAATNRLSSAQGYRFDEAGNMIGADYLHLDLLEYDVFQRPSFLSGQGIHRQHLYTAGGERLAVFDDMAGVDRFTIRGQDGQVLREYQLTRSSLDWETLDYVYRGGKLLASFADDPAQGVRHFHLDHLNSTRLVTDAGGAVLAEHVYDPFGIELTPRGSDGTRVRFAGHERDFHLEDPANNPQRDDLDYLHARYYSPEIGRFLSVDPVKGTASVIGSWNRYSYALNNPLTLVDPDGMDEQDFEFASSHEQESARYRYEAMISEKLAIRRSQEVQVHRDFMLSVTSAESQALFETITSVPLERLTVPSSGPQFLGDATVATINVALLVSDIQGAFEIAKVAGSRLFSKVPDLATLIRQADPRQTVTHVDELYVMSRNGPGVFHGECPGGPCSSFLSQGSMDFISTMQHSPTGGDGAELLIEYLVLDNTHDTLVEQLIAKPIEDVSDQMDEHNVGQ